MLRIYGITYGDKTTEYIPYVNDHPAKAWRFEQGPVMDIIDNYISDLNDSDYLGILSWKFRQKTGAHHNILSARFERYTAKYVGGADVINLSPYLGRNIGGKYGTFMDWSDLGHKGLRDIIKKCCEHVGLKYNNDPRHVIYANQFIARKRVYTHYVNTIIKPCLELLEGELWPVVNQDAGYTAGLSKEELMKHTGLEFYNYVPFCMERMFMQYVHNHRIKTISLL
jgi:hypothetical protein